MALKKTAKAKAVAKKPAKKAAAKTAKPVKPVKKAAVAKPKPKTASKAPAQKKAPVAKAPVAQRKPAAAAKTAKPVAPAKAAKPVAPARKPAPKPEPAKKKALIAKKPEPTNGKPAAAKTQKPAEDTGERLAFGMYGGVLLCANPKPFPKKTPYTEKEIKTVRNILMDQRGKLREVLRRLDNMTLRRMEEGADTSVPGYSVHMAENATDDIDTETALLLRRDEEASLMQVEAAVDRLNNGIFGVCMACGSKIGIERLKAKPEAHLCMDCQRAYSEKSSGR